MGNAAAFYPTANFNELVRYTQKWLIYGAAKVTTVIIAKNSDKSLEEAKSNKVFSVIEAVIAKEDLSDELLLWIKELHS